MKLKTQTTDPENATHDDKNSSGNIALKVISNCTFGYRNRGRHGHS